VIIADWEGDEVSVRLFKKIIFFLFLFFSNINKNIQATRPLSIIYPNGDRYTGFSALDLNNLPIRVS
jgi:hypothetical protein